MSDLLISLCGGITLYAIYAKNKVRKRIIQKLSQLEEELTLEIQYMDSLDLMEGNTQYQELTKALETLQNSNYKKPSTSPKKLIDLKPVIVTCKKYNISSS